MAKRKGTTGLNGEALVALLRKLPASGDGSFEHLLRDLLSRATGRRFTLVKSGPQGGSDNLTGDDRHATRIGVEAKRYGAATILPLDEAKSKLRDAAATHPDLDLWILVATREVKEPDPGSLQQAGHDVGVGVLILDWPESFELLPGLLLLAAANPDILSAYGVLTTSVVALLEEVRTHPTYARQRDELIANLLQPELGYANARDAMAERLRESMSSLPAAAARIGRYANLTDPQVLRIDRPKVRRALTTWWEQPARQTLVLLGTEGVGKTWAALSWWLDREGADNPLPLTLVVPARSVDDPDPDAVIGKALFSHFRTRDAAWWARRARRWSAAGDGTRLVVILDGLNERFDAQDWSALVAECNLGLWTGAVAFILSDRFDHWRLIAPAFAAAGLECLEEPVEQFSDGELDELLGRAGLDRKKLDARLIPILKVPRLCTLAIRHWEKLDGGGDITPERLIYEDFRDRVYPDLSDDEMRNLIAMIGEQIRESGSTDITVLRRQIREALAEESGSAGSNALISEIASGIWFRPLPGEPHRLKLNADLAPMAIGLALSRAVQSLESAADVAARIESFLDDLRGLELGVTIVGIAASFATVWPHATDVARDSLLDAWLGSDNLTDDELKRYSRLIQERPDLFLERTEKVWRDRDRIYNDRNVHLAGIANAAEAYPLVLAKFAERATAWLGETYPYRDAMNGGEPVVQVGGRAVRERVAAWNAARGFLPPLTMIDRAEDEDWVSVSRPVLQVISYLPRAPFAAALGLYAVATALTRRFHFQETHYNWLLRANVADPLAAEPALLAQAEAIAEVAHPDAQAAAEILMEALSPLNHPASPPLLPAGCGGAPLLRWIVRDESGMTRWLPDTGCDSEGWQELALRRTGGLAALAIDPDASLEEESVALLREAFGQVLAQDVKREFELGDGLRAVLARWAPDLLARFCGRTSNIASNAGGTQTIMADLQSCWIVHDETTTRGIRTAFEASVRALSVPGAGIHAELIVLALAGRPASDQIAAFLSMPAGPIWPLKFERLLEQPRAPEFALIAAELWPERNPGELAAWLNLLGHSDLSFIPSDFSPVAALFGHADPKVRTAAYEVATQAGQIQLRQLADELRDSGWSATTATGEEAFQGSVALAFAQPVENDDRPDRMLGITLGLLSREWPDVAVFAHAFAAHVKQRVEHELRPVGEARGYGFFIKDDESYDRLVAEQGDMVESWLDPVVADDATIGFGYLMFSAERATVQLCRALIAAGRDAGAAAQRKLAGSLRGSNLRIDELELLPFQAPSNPVSEPLRQESLSNANLDDMLYAIAFALQKRGEVSWLTDVISGLLRGTVLERARGLVLAAALDCNPEAEALWKEYIIPLELPLWLDRVRTQARAQYLRNAHARHWLRAFCDAVDPMRQFSAFELFAAAASRTSALWATEMIDAAKPTLEGRAYQHWLMNVPRLNEELKERDKGSKDRLAFDVVPRRDQGPWR